MRRPVLLEVARIVAYSRDPAQAAAIAAVVLLVFGLVRLLDHLAARHTTDQALRWQLRLAGTHLAGHPYVANYPTTRPAHQTAVPSRPPIAEVDHLRRARPAGPTGHHGRGR